MRTTANWCDDNQTRAGSERRVAAMAALCVALLTACGSTVAGHSETTDAQAQLADYRPVQLTFQPADKAKGVAPNTPVKVFSSDGRIENITVHAVGDDTPLPGSFSSDKSSWTASSGLAPGAQYVATASAVTASGNSITASAAFSTVGGGERLITTANPGDGETVGVGMPIKLNFNTSIPDALQYPLVSHLQVISDPPQAGEWHWFAPWEVHYRPKAFWQPHTKVTLKANLQGVNAGDGYWGFGNWSETFTIGDSHITKIDHNTEMGIAYENDQPVRTIPVSLGKAGFPTLSGTLVVWSKAYKVRMNSCTSGIACSGSNFYDEDVYWDTAISTDGFFIHDAYWDIAAQGHYDFSHGCVNVSPENAIWFYNWAQKGDIVEIANTGRIADAGDGEGDWQLPFDQFANSGGAPTYAPRASSGGI